MVYIQNAYTQAPVSEKIYTVLEPEFGTYSEKPDVVARALYGLKSAGDTFWAHLADCMNHVDYKSFPADP